MLQTLLCYGMFQRSLRKKGIMLIFYLALLGFWEVGCTDDFFLKVKVEKQMEFRNCQDKASQ